ncbi:hypothetical protein N7509_010137 [Penicillium cosmopolitanum]|uniref:CST complex subunit Stn1 N-terminal domain-containing protein n=1 Tax=Penicillium cosmopolitanum TaxID=1131564 RepID=A0A9W9VQR1_9EURO|nr:uncharacterized protein N7509_010137 [Penicillium cosmopolitanum]KAJ5387596.1 hypothetical protein N7509_010137 [Penicillium cosmopolitanum]
MEKHNDVDPTFYPAFCFKASPTHFAWVKMALADVHKLHRPEGFSGQNLFFYKNHPITFISVVGVIVARNEITRRTILTIDDSSGSTLDIVILQADPKEKISTENSAQVRVSSYPTAASTASFNLPMKPAATADLDPSAEEPPDLLAMNQIVHVSATDRTIIDISKLVPGTTVKVKGTVNRFRSTMQVNLERFALVHDTNSEMQFVDARLRFLVEVLSVPWVLLDEEIEALRREAERGGLEIADERRRAEKRVRMRAEREERDQRHIQKRYEKEERKRAQGAGVCKEDGVKVMHDIRLRKKRDLSVQGGSGKP